MSDKPKKLKPQKLPTIAKLRKNFKFFKELKLKPKQIKFICYYCQLGFNATEAYKQAGYKYKNNNSASATSSGMLRQPNIKKGIRMYLDEALGVFKDKLEKEIFDMLYRQMTYDPFMFINTDGSPKFKKPEDIKPEWRCCIKAIETKLYGQSETRITKITLVDREQAVEKLAKYITMFKDTLEINWNITDSKRKELDDIYNNHKNEIVDYKRRKA